MDKRLYPIRVDFFKAQIVPLIEASKKKSGRPSKVDLYSFFCGVLYVLRTGVSWRDLPPCFGKWHTIYTRFKRWSESGFFWNLLYQLQSKQKICMDIVFVDGSIVPLHRHGGGAFKKKGQQAVGRGRKGLGSTMHMAVAKDCIVNCMLFPAQRQDCKSFEEVCKTWPWKKIKHVVADKGYDTRTVRSLIRDHGATPVIPPKGIYVLPGSDLKPSDCYDVQTYRKRHFIERLFGRIKENKRIAMRFDKLDTIFLSFIALALLKAYKLFC